MSSSRYLRLRTESDQPNAGLSEKSGATSRGLRSACCPCWRLPSIARLYSRALCSLL